MARNKKKLLFIIATLITAFFTVQSANALGFIGLWPTPGSTAPFKINTAKVDDQQKAAGCKTTTDEYIVGWVDNELNNGDLYIAKFNATDGTKIWGDIAYDTTSGNNIASSYRFDIQCEPDQSGGAYFAYHNSNGGSKVQITKINGTDGSAMWSPSTIDLTDTVGSGSGNQIHLISSDTVSGAYIAWLDSSTLNVTKINPDGTISAGWNPALTYTSDGNYDLALDSSGYLYVTYSDSSNIYTAKLDPAGLNDTGSWSSGAITLPTPADYNGYSFSSLDNYDIDTSATTDDGLVVSYKATYGSNTDFYAVVSTKFNADGTVAWTETPAIINDNFNNQNDYLYSGPFWTLPTNNGGASTIYLINKNADSSYNYYMTSVDGDGNKPSQIPLEGKAITDYQTTSSYTYYSGFGRTDRVKSDGQGGGFFAAYNYNGSTTYYSQIQHFDQYGNLGMGPNGITIEDDPADSYTSTYGRVFGDPDEIEALHTYINYTSYPNYYEVFGQLYYEPFPCEILDSNEFCGTMTISSQVLTFDVIPNSFNFGEIFAGTTNHLFNNDHGTNLPDVNDQVVVRDDRNSGGFT
ncbi:hypothetical protein GF340_04360, partial [Candidatus Peregrinibacteria bacterium]|nr:hypothetical protein [Candidatus Peregrinibacteria bacterium]